VIGADGARCDGGEGVQQGLGLGKGQGLGWLGAEPVLHRLLEPLDLALGLGVVRLAVFLPDAETAQLVLEAVAAASAAGQAGGEHHSVSEGRGRNAAAAAGGAEGVQHVSAGHAAIGGN
jgi:hypothetical protein